MELKVTTLEGKDAGSVQLSDAIFGLEPRADIIARCVQWQLNRRQAGTHKAKGRAEIWRTGKKMYKQKGTGGARHGSARVPQFRGGGRAFPLLGFVLHDDDGEAARGDLRRQRCERFQQIGPVDGRRHDSRHRATSRWGRRSLRVCGNRRSTKRSAVGCGS